MVAPIVSLNPKPLPPDGTSLRFDPGLPSALNPKPLPPGETPVLVLPAIGPGQVT
jgi:hypothetical protein